MRKNKKVPEKYQVHLNNCRIEDWAWVQVTAISEGHVAGTATIYFLDDVHKSPELCNMFVNQAFQQEGIGTKILELVREKIKDTNRPLNLHCKVDSIAHKWYLRAGFIEVGEAINEEIYLIDNFKKS